MGMSQPPEETAESFAKLIDQVRAGEEQSIAKLWENYFQQLVRVAANRLPANLRRTGDEEDIALSAFHSFIAGVRDDRFPDLSGPDNLWGLLITLTGRKVNAHMRHHTRQKRGGGSVRGESVFITPGGETKGGGIGGTSGNSQAADIHTELAEACENLLDQLDDEQLKQIAVMRMDGYLVDEIAERMQLSKRAVERRLQLIRRIWSEQAESME
jgi:DNA-directed RNA polymerase specialized sigma24 family protein